MASEKLDPVEISFEEGTTYGGLVLLIASFLAYLGIILTRARTDQVPLVDVAWRGPMLLVVLVSGVLYGLGYLVARLRHRGPAEDARDREITRYGDSISGALASLTIFVTLIMLALEVDTFWVVHNLFLGSGFATFVGTAARIGAYHEGIPS